MASVAADTSTKRAFKDVNVSGAATAAKKQKISAALSVRNDIRVIQSILGDIKDPTIKAALENIIKDPTGASNAPKKDEATIQSLTDMTVRTMQGLINEKLKWKSSYKYLKGGDTKGGRIEVACNEPEVFERIFKDATIKKGKDGKLSCNIKTEEEVRKVVLPFKGVKYRYGSSYLSAPYMASLKDNKLSFTFKFSL